MAHQESSMPFIKNLASSNIQKRSSALHSLRAFLSAPHVSTRLTPLEILKLWKGLYYALWMADKPLPQQALCAELAALPISVPLPESAVAPWLRGFWMTMAREWTNIDVYRIEKFMLLVRRVLGASFAWMRSKDEIWKNAEGKRWNVQSVDTILRLLDEGPLSPADIDYKCSSLFTAEQVKELGAFAPRYVPAGLRLHVLDIWVDEAEKAGLLDDGESIDSQKALGILQRISDLIDALEKNTKSPAIRARCKDSLSDERLPWNRKSRAEGQHAEDSDGSSWEGFDD